MKPYTAYNPLTGAVRVGLPVALPERALVVVVEAAWGDTSDGTGERVRLDPVPANRAQRAAACALAEPLMAMLAARLGQRDNERMTARWRRGSRVVHWECERLRSGGPRVQTWQERQRGETA